MRFHGAAGVTVAAVAALVVAAPAARANPGDKHVTTSYAQAAPTHALTVHDDVGEVTVRRGSPGQVVATKRWLVREPQLSVTRNGDALDVQATCPSNVGVNDCSVDLTITLPDAFSVSVTNGVGDIDVAGAGGVVALASDVGDVKLADVVAPSVTLSSGSGGVSAAGLDVRRIQTKVDNGSTTIITRTAPDAVEARGDNGSVDVAVPAGAYAITAAADNGSHEVRGVQNDPGAPRKISAVTSNGDVLVRSLDAGAAAPSHPGRDVGSSDPDGSHNAASATAPVISGQASPSEVQAPRPMQRAPSFAALEHSARASTTTRAPYLDVLVLLAAALVIVVCGAIPRVLRRH